MNKIRDDYPPDLKKFLIDLQSYIDTDIYLYGSVNRIDYVHGKSDIDIGIFTDNEYSMMTRLQHFLHVKRDAFDKIVWKLEGKMIYGYKIKCDKYINSKCEISIYNNDFKETIINDWNNYKAIPFYISILLFILKTLYYKFPILSQETYAKYKRFIFNRIIVDKSNSMFILLPKK
jgi:predicted nucleotidyltransferase